MTDWIEAERLKRIAEGEAKYGAWTTENFRLTGRSGINESIPELLDAISYLEMGYALGEISVSEFCYYQWILTDIANRLDRRRDASNRVNLP
jgi:hypothetical protein